MNVFRFLAKRTWALTAVLLVIASLAQAHEFWLQPKKFRYKTGEEVQVDFLVGENFIGNFWDLTQHKVERLEWITAYGKKDLSKEVKSTKGNNLTFKIATEGGQLVVMQSNTAFIEMDAEKFNAFLEEDGLEEILDQRTNKNELNKPSRETYTRYAKLLLQSGARKDEVFKRKTGQKLEIIPLNDPYALKTGDHLECQVLFNGQPGNHQLVKVWSVIGNRNFLQNIYTENDGTLKFPISSKGPWMVSTVKMVPSDKEGVDYESMWASLVFGVE